MNLGNLSILSWNVRGLDDQNKCSLVKDTVRAAKASIACFQETKLEVISYVKLVTFVPPSLFTYSFLPSIGTKGGALTTWNSNYTLTQTYTLTYSVTILLTNTMDFQFMLSNVYGPIDTTHKADFLNEIRLIACLHDTPWILIGDFNILRAPHETTATDPNNHSMLEFNTVISDLNPREVPLFGRL
jgi:exonuclease III